MKTSILLVDDEEIILESLALDLRQDGYEVTTASNGELAIQKIQKQSYSVVITDLMMDRVGGMQVLECVRKKNPESVVIILTGHADLDSAVEALRLGADDFLQKPCAYEELAMRLHNVLSRKALEEQLRSARSSAIDSEEALRRSEERLRTMADFAYDWEYWIDERSEFVYTSPSCLRITGYRDSEFKQNPSLLEEICLETDRPLFGRHLHLEEEGRMTQSLEFRITTRDGAVKWISHNCQPVYSENGRYLGRRASNRDITDRKRMEEELIKAKKLQAATVLAGGIAHDYNNLLTAIIGNIDLAAMIVPSGDKSWTYLENAKKASLRARDLTLKFLTFSMGSSPLKKIVSINSILLDATELALSGSNVRCDFKLPEDLWLVNIDAGQFGQAVTNLILNAKESMPDGGTVEVGVENYDVTDMKAPFYLPTEKYLRISIKDTGCGIREEDLDKIFDPYFSTKQRGSQKGMGLGLTVVHSIIEKHFGHIHIDSKPGKGTTVEIMLPAVVRQAGVVSGEGRQEPTQIDFARKHKRIMVMDDEEVVRDVAEIMLAQAGYEVDLVQDGAEAVRVYERRLHSDSPVDLVILDLTVPGGMGGRDAVLEIHKLDPQARVIVSSGYTSDPIMINYQVYGFCAAIGKPYQYQDFIKAVAKALH